MAITFDKIKDQKTPAILTEILVVNRGVAVPDVPDSVVMVAQMTSSGSVSGTPRENTVIQVSNSDEVATLAGSGSIAHKASVAILNAAKVDLYVVLQDDAGGAVSATGTYTFATNALTSGNMTAWVGKDPIVFSVAIGDTPTVQALAMKTEMDSLPDLAVTAGVAAGVLTTTAKNGGTLGNNIPLSIDLGTVTGTTVVIVQSGTVIAGATDPTFQDALDAIFPSNLRYIFSTYNDATALNLLETHLEDSAEPDQKHRRIGFCGVAYITTTAVKSLATGVNEERISIGYWRYDKATNQGHALDYELGGVYVAIYQSVPQPNIPRSGLVLPGIPAAALQEQLDPGEIESLLNNGVTAMKFVPGEGVTISRAITTRSQTNGFKDDKQLDVGLVNAYDFTALTLELNYADILKGKVITNQLIKDIKSIGISVERELEISTILRNVVSHIDDFIVEESKSNTGQVNVQTVVEVAPGFEILAIKLVVEA